MDNPWYLDGLRFQCTRCGNCCTGEPGYVWVNEAEIAAIAELLNLPIEEFQRVYTRKAGKKKSLRERLNGDCIFYDRENGCTIYPVRPRQCQTWPFWESNVSTAEHWQRTRKECPGAGQGELISKEEITRRIKVVKL